MTLLPTGNEPPADEAEIQRLVERARSRDRAAAARLYRLHVRRVYRAVRPLAGTNDEAEEIVQEAFIKAFAALGRYRRKGETRFISWLLTIAVNTARKRAKHSRRKFVPTEPATVERMDDQKRAQPTADGDTEELRQRALLQALSELEPRDREVLTLRYGAGLSAAEVGRTCRVGVANVRKICQRQRGRLAGRVETLMQAPDSLMESNKMGQRA